MRKKKYFCLVLIALVICGANLGATRAVTRYYLEYCYISPVHTDKSHPGKVLAKLCGNGTLTNKGVFFYLYNSKRPSGSNIMTLRPSDESGIINKTYKGTEFIKGEENRLKIFLTDSDGTRTEHWFSGVVDDTYRSINVDRLGSLTYEVGNISAYTRSRGSFTGLNRYCFNNWYVLNDIHVYNKFDIEMFTFEEYFDELKIPVENCSIELYIPAIYGLFNDLSITEVERQRAVISLRLRENDDLSYSLVFNQALYVNPFTYEMSRSPKNGFVQTKYLYLPKTGFASQEKLDFRIVGEQLGTMLVDFDYHFSIEAERNRIGNCVTSEYCIHTNDAQFTDYGKVLNHD